jgi:bifunctional DNase/RNase
VIKEFLVLLLAFGAISLLSIVNEPYYGAELRGVIISPEVAYVILETRAGNLSMVLSPLQGIAVRDAVNGTEHYRPTTHDLAAELAGIAGARKLHLRVGVVEVRPSDGVVVCMETGCPIYIARHLVGKNT